MYHSPLCGKTTEAGHDSTLPTSDDTVDIILQDAGTSRQAKPLDDPWKQPSPQSHPFPIDYDPTEGWINSAKAIVLPQPWREMPAHWFQVVEATFQLHRITSVTTLNIVMC